MVNAAAAESYTLAPRRRPHIVDVLIEERAPSLSASPVWPLVRPALYALLDYRKARAMADAIAPMSGRQALDHVSGLLSVRVQARGLENLPARVRCVIVANHPTGIADGIAVHDGLKARRPDMVFYANSDAHRVSRRLAEVLIPVEWVEEKRTRERTRLTLQMTKEAMEAGHALTIFPAGRLARRVGGVLTDKPWQASALSIARKYDAPVIPVHVAGPFATLFHLFDRISPELRDITLFHELLNKKGARYSLTVGEALDPHAIDSIEALKDHVERGLA